MVKVPRYIFFLILIQFIVSCEGDSTPKNEVGELEWLPFNQEVFEKSKKEQKLVLLDVGANWCHWCHAMDDSTYDDPEVITFLNEHFVLSKEDQDSRPDLYAAYRSHGWPATIVFNSKGEELLKLRGYQHRKKFIRQLQAVLDAPIPLKEERKMLTLNKNVDSDFIKKRYVTSLNHEIGGYKSSKMQLHKEGLEFGLCYGREDQELDQWTEKTYQASLNLMDPIWGGISQYSDSWVWTNPHYEKLLKVQANYISAYCRYAAVKNDDSAIEAAENIYAYCDRFLSSKSPLFDNSQNADLVDGVHSGDYYDLNEEERLAKGVPSVDKRHYLKENAMMIVALVDLWAATGKEKYLNRAEKISSIIINNFKTTYGGLFGREKEGFAEVFPFEDNRVFSKALLQLYRATGDETYLVSSVYQTYLMFGAFKQSGGLFAPMHGDLVVQPNPVQLDNLNFVVDLTLLSHYTKDEAMMEVAVQLFESLDAKVVRTKMWYIPVTYEANRYLNTEPYHAVLLINDQNSDWQKEMSRRLLLHRDQFIIVDCKDVNQLNEEDEMMYGGVEANTLFMCTDSYCSSPIYTVADLDDFLESSTTMAF
ncbi:MAG: DUF255 domain-containing protein [Flavobacteriales bacterium]|nr:DUF255 domain-containing protein [Flavobacteriales bacterium]